MHLPVSTQTLALLALVFSVLQQGINCTTLVRKVLEKRVRRLDDALGTHVLPKAHQKDPTVIAIAEIESIRLKPRQ